MKSIMCLVFAVRVALPAPALAQERVQAKAALPQFQVDPFWPKPLPNNWILGQVSGIAVDRFDRIWVVHRPGTLNERELAAAQTPPTAKCCFAAPPVLVFDQSGNLLRAWGGPGQGYEWPQSEHGVFIDDNDFVWLAGNGKLDGQLLKFTMDGKFALQVGKSGPIRGSNDTTALGSPADVAVDVEAKEVYAADGYTNRRVVVFDSEGAYKPHWGAYGNKPSDDKTPAYDPASVAAVRQSSPLHPHLKGRPRLCM
jgi:DNA-binding beta-propeller fold protein YncE